MREFLRLRGRINQKVKVKMRRWIEVSGAVVYRGHCKLGGKFGTGESEA
jgi:hypothetical protein